MLALCVLGIALGDTVLTCSERTRVTPDMTKSYQGWFNNDETLCNLASVVAAYNAAL